MHKRRSNALLSLVLLVTLTCVGCTTYKRAFVAIHDSIDEALASQTNAPVVNPVALPSNLVATTTSEPAIAPSGPRQMPLQSHGSEAQVDQWLKDGGAPECGGISPDCRAMLVRPSGNTWGYAPFWQSGACLGLDKDGNIAFKDTSFEGQNYFLLGWSVHENLDTVTPLKSGVRTKYQNDGHGMFIFFEAR